MSNVQQHRESIWRRVWSVLTGPMPRPVRFVLTAYAPGLLLCAVLCAVGVVVAIPVVLLLPPEAFARTPAPLRRPAPISFELVAEMAVFCALLGVLVLGACWFVSSRRWAVAGRYACPLAPLLGGVAGCIEWLRDPSIAAGEVLYGALLVFFCTVGSFVGGCLGDRRRLRSQPASEAHSTEEPLQPHRGEQ